jgi:glutathione peroxidase
VRKEDNKMNVLNFDVVGAKGEVVSMAQFRNKVLLIINSATRCGFTPQYDELQDLFEKFQSEDFMILDFPCNQFNNQAPESNEEIATFCDVKFGIKSPIMSKIEVNGENALPLFKYLVEQRGFKGFDPEHPLTPILESMASRNNPDYANEPDIKWNFTKFLVDRNGDVIERFEPTTDMAYVEGKVKELL